MASDTAKELQKLLSSGIDITSDKINRRQACQVAHKLWLDLEEPGDLIDRIIYQTQENVILRVALDLGIYNYMVNREQPANSNDIATSTGADPALVGRILRNLAALGHLDETGADLFKANKVTHAFTTSKGINGANFSFEIATPAWNAIPAYLKSRSYRNPSDPVNAPLQEAFSSRKHFFDLLVERNVLEAFQNFMSAYRTDRADFLDIFPAEEHLLQGYGGSHEEVLLVDVGGGVGHEIEKFVNRFPDKNMQMVLQELPEIVSQVPRSDIMTVMVHDFFTPQPVMGARSYYLRMILHDWPDDQSVAILENIAAAMRPGYSKVLINDIVLPNVGATRFAVQSDIGMMALLAASERNETQWRLLLERAGLSITKIWPGIPESVIEAELAESKVPRE